MSGEAPLESWQVGLVILGVSAVVLAVSLAWERTWRKTEAMMADDARAERDRAQILAEIEALTPGDFSPFRTEAVKRAFGEAFERLPAGYQAEDTENGETIIIRPAPRPGQQKGTTDDQ